MQLWAGTGAELSCLFRGRGEKWGEQQGAVRQCWMGPGTGWRLQPFQRSS